MHAGQARAHASVGVGEDAIEVARLVERGLRQSQAVDQEALCVLAGRKVGSQQAGRGAQVRLGCLPRACCMDSHATRTDIYSGWPTPPQIDR